MLNIGILNILILCLFISAINGCARLKIDDKTDCNISMDKVLEVLHEQNINITEGVIYNPDKNYSNLTLNIDCIGLYYIGVRNWKKVKNEANIVSIPILVLYEQVFINTYFMNGLPRTDGDIDQVVDSLFNSFKAKHSELFSKEDLNFIQERFYNGISVNSKGRMF